MSKLTKKLSVVILSVLLALSMFMVLAVSFNAKADTAPLSKSHLITKGAAIRLDKEPNGIRFPLFMKTSDYQTYASDIVESGMIFAPEALYKAEEFDVDVATPETSDTVAARKVVNNSWVADTDENGKPVMRIMVTITGIPETQLAQRICFVGYVKTATGEVIYTDVVSRSIAEVACMHILDKGEEAASVAYEFIPGGDVETLAEQEFEVYSAINTTTNALTANNLTVDISATNSTVIKFAKIVNDKKELVVDATLAGGEVSILGTDIGAKIYGDCDLVLFTDTSTIVAPVNIITKKINTLDEMRRLAYFGGMDAEGKNYDGYFVLTQDIGNESWAIYSRKFDYKTTGFADSGYSVWKYTEEGFLGVFDGQGHYIYNVIFWGKNGEDPYKSRGGLFGNVADNAVVKNLGLVARVETDPHTWCSVAPIADKFAGTLENCYIDVTVKNTFSSSSNYQVIPTAMNTTRMTMKDVVIKLDATNAVSGGYLSGDLAQYKNSSKPTLYDNSASSFTNVIPFVKEPAGVTVYASCGLGAQYAALPNDPAKDVVKYAYDAEVEFTPSDATYWNLNGKQPLWGAIPVEVEVQGTDFEVYNSISGTTPVANTLSINLADGAIANPQSVVLSTEKGDTTLTTADYAIADGTLTISGDKFGASVYGDVSVKITENKTALVYKTNVITKKISTLADMQNFAVYGGVLNDQTNYDYDGYYVLTQNIECDPTVVYVKATGWGYNTTEPTFWQTYPNGFKGIFDGQGFSIKNVFFNNYNSCSGGLFGNVHSTGVVKNLGVSIIFRNTKQDGTERNVGLAYKFAGKLENCYVEVCGQAGDNLSGETSPIAKNVSTMTTNDVVIKADLSMYKDATGTSNTTTKGVAFFCNTWAPFGYTNNYRPSKYNNVHAFVKEPEDKSVNLYHYGYNAACYTGSPYNFNAETAVAKYAYDATIETPITFTSNAFWTTNANGQPIFASMVAVAAE